MSNNRKKVIMQPYCPNCKRVGPDTLHIEVLCHLRETGAPYVRCSSVTCSGTWEMGVFFTNMLDFFKYIEIVGD